MVRRGRRRRANDGEKNADNLAWLFYKDGVRELTLAPGFEETEVVKLLEIIQRARKASADEDDLVTMLWEADFTFLKYRVRRSAPRHGGGELADGSEVDAGEPRRTSPTRHARRGDGVERRAGS